MTSTCRSLLCKSQKPITFNLNIYKIRYKGPLCSIAYNEKNDENKEINLREIDFNLAVSTSLLYPFCITKLLSYFSFILSLVGLSCESSKTSGLMESENDNFLVMFVHKEFVFARDNS